MRQRDTHTHTHTHTQDFCPIFLPVGENNNCQIPIATPIAGIESFGSASFCFETSLTSAATPSFAKTGGAVLPLAPACLKTACIREGAGEGAGITVVITVMPASALAPSSEAVAEARIRGASDPFASEVQIRCTSEMAGRQVRVRGFSGGLLVCPDAFHAHAVCKDRIRLGAGGVGEAWARPLVGTSTGGMPGTYSAQVQIAERGKNHADVALEELALGKSEDSSTLAPAQAQGAPWRSAAAVGVAAVAATAAAVAAVAMFTASLRVRRRFQHCARTPRALAASACPFDGDGDDAEFPVVAACQDAVSI